MRTKHSMSSRPSRTFSQEEERVRTVIAGWFQASNMTQSMVAEKVGVTQTAVSAFLLGKRFASIDTLKGFCQCFGHRMGDLFDVEPMRAADPEAEKVMRRYRAISPTAQRAVIGVLESFVQTRRRFAAK